MKLLTQSLFLAFAVFSINHSQASDIQRIENLMQQWLGIEQQIDRLKVDWQQQKPVLEQRLALLKAEKQSIETQLSSHSGVQSRVQARRAELAEQQSQLEQNQQALNARIEQSKQVLQQLLPRLPEPLANHWRKKMSALAIKGTGSSGELGIYLTMLKAMQEFQNKITLHQSLMELNGQEQLVDQVYLGLAQGWYRSRDGQFAGYGYANHSEWQWHSDNNLSEELATFVKALNHPDKARLISLPLVLSESQDVTHQDATHIGEATP